MWRTRTGAYSACCVAEADVIRTLCWKQSFSIRIVSCYEAGGFHSEFKLFLFFSLLYAFSTPPNRRSSLGYIWIIGRITKSMEYIEQMTLATRRKLIIARRYTVYGRIREKARENRSRRMENMLPLRFWASRVFSCTFSRCILYSTETSIDLLPAQQMPASAKVMGVR